MWDNDALSLNGEMLFQTFSIHTGTGSNSKYTTFNFLKKALGSYFVEVTA